MSRSEAGYAPIHWASDREINDLRAALAYLRSRPDRDPAGFGLFGVSRGGTTALLVAPVEVDVWGVITDGAFPTIGTMVAYALRWTELYVRTPFLRRLLPRWLYHVLAWSGRRNSERRLNCRFPDVERAVSRLAPRPWLMIHGARDTYISPEIAENLFRARERPQGTLARPGCQAQSLPRARARGVRRATPGLHRPLRPASSRHHADSGPTLLVPTHADLTDGYSSELNAPELAREVVPAVSTQYAVGSAQ